MNGICDFCGESTKYGDGNWWALGRSFHGKCYDIRCFVEALQQQMAMSQQQKQPTAAQKQKLWAPGQSIPVEVNRKVEVDWKACWEAAIAKIQKLEAQNARLIRNADQALFYLRNIENEKLGG